MEISELRNSDTKALESMLAKKQVEYFEFRLQKTTSGIEKPHLYKSLKKDIARINMVIGEKRKSSK